MKAFTYYNYGGLEKMQVEERNKPQPKKKEVLIKTICSSVTRTDTTMIGADYLVMRLYLGLFKPKKNIIGTQFAGIITEIGEQVTKFKVGDRIFGFEDEGLGCYAEYFTVAENKNIAKIPSNISFMEAANTLEGYHYARNFLNKIKINKNDKILINGATGGIGTALLQLLQKEEVIVHTTSRKEHFNLMEKLGSKKCIDYTTESYWKEDEIYDIVLDSVGKSRFKFAKEVLHPKGIYISSELGPKGENIWHYLLSPLYKKQKVKFPWPLGLKKTMEELIKDWKSNKYTAHIEMEYKFNDLLKALHYVMSGQKVGNVGIQFD